MSQAGGFAERYPMPARVWLFLAAILGGLAVAAGAVGAHVLSDTATVDGPLQQAYRTGHLNHAIHALALLAAGILMLRAQERGPSFSAMALQAAAVCFTIGIVLFSGGIYAHVAGGIAAVTRFVPVGGMVLIAGWVALAAGALGLRS
jgi:uncharacterized membrane protein YgdD (TMEM256/DUF423 family)